MGGLEGVWRGSGGLPQKYLRGIDRFDGAGSPRGGLGLGLGGWRGVGTSGFPALQAAHCAAHCALNH